MTVTHRFRIAPQIELWATELMTSVIQLSSSGQILNGKMMPLYPPGLLLGVSGTVMRGLHISKYFPMLKGKSMSTLFTLNGLSGVTPANLVPGQSEHPGKLSSLKDVSSLPKGLPETVGPILHVRVKHQTDDTDIQLTVQVGAEDRQSVTFQMLVCVYLHINVLCSGPCVFN